MEEKAGSERVSVLQEQGVRNWSTRGEEKGCGREAVKKRESTYILKQKFAKIRRSMVLMGEDKENIRRRRRYG